MEVNNVTIGSTTYVGVSKPLSPETIEQIKCCKVGVRAAKHRDAVDAHSQRSISTFGFELLCDLIHTTGVVMVEFSPGGCVVVGFRDDLLIEERARATQEIGVKLRGLTV